MELYIIRHTPVDVKSGTCYGQSDVDVNDQFKEYLETYRQKLPTDFDCVYSSPLNRCKILAENLFSDEIIIDARLMEMNFGDWELKNWKDISIEESQTWTDDFVNNSPPNGESMKKLFDRIKSFFEEIKSNDFNKVLIVTHGGPIRCFWSIILELNIANAFKIPVGFGEILVIDTKLNSIIQKQ